MEVVPGSSERGGAADEPGRQADQPVEQGQRHGESEPLTPRPPIRQAAPGGRTLAFDEVSDDDDVIVLHQGRVLMHGSVSRVMEAADARDIRAAFTWLTHGAEAATEVP